MLNVSDNTIAIVCRNLELTTATANLGLQEDLPTVKEKEQVKVYLIIAGRGHLKHSRSSTFSPFE
jgi:hypothetical protein